LALSFSPAFFFALVLPGWSATSRLGAMVDQKLPGGGPNNSVIAKSGVSQTDL
jgi:hypothetical protein